MIDSDAEFVSAVGFAIGYALLVLFGFCYSVSGLISLYKKEKKEDEKEMEEEKRHIELAVIKSELDQVTFRIADQTHFGKDFCPKGKVFKAKNGISILSLPKTIIGGISPKNGEYKCRIDKFILVMESVAEYNETNGNGYETPWPRRNDVFYYVSATGRVVRSLYWDDDPEHLDLKKNGNFFRTREDAEAALERVKKALKGE